MKCKQDPFLSYWGEESPRPGLSRIKKFLDYLNNPHLGYKSVLIAGTNGKGSTAHYCARIMANTGLKVGLFTSPHLLSVRERIKILNPDEKVIPAEELVETAQFLRNIQNKLHIPLTYFEALTAAAFLYFKKQKIDVAVLEVGLGGRLDATNVSDKLVTVITEISRDHISILGRRVTDIAREKAGIITGKAPLITGASGKSLKVIKEISTRKRCEMLTMGRDFTFYKKGDLFEANVQGTVFFRKVPPLFPEFLQKNLALGICAAFKALKREKISLLQDALSQISLTVPGRFHIINENPLWLVDSAHNPGAMKALVKSIKSIRFTPDIIVYSRLRDKSPSMIRALGGITETLFAVEITTSSRAEKVEKIEKEAFRAGFKKVKTFRSVEDIPWHHLKTSGKKMLITGSSFLTGEVFRVLGINPLNG